MYIDNYFDIATPEELKEHYGYVPSKEEVTQDRLLLANDRDHNLQYLYWLYMDRGDEKTAEFYLNQIEDWQRKLDAAALVGDAIEG